MKLIPELTDFYYLETRKPKEDYIQIWLHKTKNEVGLYTEEKDTLTVYSEEEVVQWNYLFYRVTDIFNIINREKLQGD